MISITEKIRQSFGCDDRRADFSSLSPDETFVIDGLVNPRYTSTKGRPLHLSESTKTRACRTE